MRQAEFNKLTFLKAFTYVDEHLDIVRVEVRRDPDTGLTFSTRTPMRVPAQAESMAHCHAH